LLIFEVKPKPKKLVSYPNLPLAPIVDTPQPSPFLNPGNPANDAYAQRKLRRILRNILARIRRDKRYDLFIKPLSDGMAYFPCQFVVLCSFIRFTLCLFLGFLFLVFLFYFFIIFFRPCILLTLSNCGRLFGHCARSY
jgi:hypothetical protein